MSHQTGIQASTHLRSFLAKAKDGDIRLIKVIISEEELMLGHSDEPQGNWEQDYDKFVVPQLEPKSPCYLIYRLDSKSQQGYEWIFISFSPDQAPVRQKMLYAATRATMKTEFGPGLIKEELFGTVPEDVKLSGYKKHLSSQNAPAPLTFAEEELEMIKRNEVNAHINVDTKHQTMKGVGFPVSHDALDKLQNLRDGALNYVQLRLDIENETIELDNFEDTDVVALSSRIPSDHARYHFFTFKHTHEGDYLESIVFIYSMPGYKCSIKERMLYSSCKSPLLDVAEQQLGIEIARKLEIDDASEISEQYLQDEVHPKKDIVRQKFSRPKGPGGRGPKRMTKTAKE